MKKIILNPFDYGYYAELGSKNPAVSAVIAILLIFTLILVLAIIGSDKR